MNTLNTQSKGRHTKRRPVLFLKQCLALFLLWFPKWRLAPFLLPVFAGLCLTACPVEPEDEGGNLIEISLPIDGSGTRHYYDLSTGEETTPAGSNWDLALEAHGGAFFVLTNSGDTATDVNAQVSGGASGQGRVWFTDATDFDAVVGKDQRALNPGEDLSDTAVYTEDRRRYVMVMAAEPAEQTLNVITYAGYRAGNGLTAETRFEYNTPDMGNMGSFSPYLFNKKQAYRMIGMPPNYTPTKQVYIVRHGDGASYSKVQLSEVYLERGTDPSHFVMQVRHEMVE
jgi:hypothetical protein